jgi:riboflavin synthase alpha subunit
MIPEALDTFLEDFGSPVVWGQVTGSGILDSPTELVAGDRSLSVEFTLTVKTSLFGNTKYGDSLTVDGANYTVRETLRLDDGQLSMIFLSKT